MSDFDTHSMYLVAQSIERLNFALLNSYRTNAENPLIESEVQAMKEHLEGLNNLLNSFQQRIKGAK
jgi:hypothetical protein